MALGIWHAVQLSSSQKVVIVGNLILHLPDSNQQSNTSDTLFNTPRPVLEGMVMSSTLELTAHNQELTNSTCMKMVAKLTYEC